MVFEELSAGKIGIHLATLAWTEKAMRDQSWTLRPQICPFRPLLAGSTRVLESTKKPSRMWDVLLVVGQDLFKTLRWNTEPESTSAAQKRSISPQPAQ